MGFFFFVFLEEPTVHVDAVRVYWLRPEPFWPIGRFLSGSVSTAASKQRRSLWRDAAMRGKSRPFRASKPVPSTRFIKPRGAGVQMSLFLGGSRQSTGQGPVCIVVSGTPGPIDELRRTPPTLNSGGPRLRLAPRQCDPLDLPWQPPLWRPTRPVRARYSAGLQSQGLRKSLPANSRRPR